MKVTQSVQRMRNKNSRRNSEPLGFIQLLSVSTLMDGCDAGFVSIIFCQTVTEMILYVHVQINFVESLHVYYQEYINKSV